MEQSETPDPAPNPPPEAPAPPQLPDTTGAVGIPQEFRLPFHGKMATPTAVPSAAERQRNLRTLQRRRRRRGFLLGLLAGQLLIAALDAGGSWFFRTHPHIKLQAPVGVPSVVFLGMALGAAVMVAALVLIFAGLGLRGLIRHRNGGLGGAVVRGARRVLLTAVLLGLTMAVILGTAWFLIPEPEWRPTVDFAREQGRTMVAAAACGARSLLRRP